MVKQLVLYFSVLSLLSFSVTSKILSDLKTESSSKLSINLPFTDEDSRSDSSPEESDPNDQPDSKDDPEDPESSDDIEPDNKPSNTTQNSSESNTTSNSTTPNDSSPDTSNHSIIIGFIILIAIMFFIFTIIVAVIIKRSKSIHKQQINESQVDYVRQS